MLRALSLLVPALIPSWRFFDRIAPSPRIEFAVLQHAQETASHWQVFCPKPATLSALHMLARLFYNPQGNAWLFLMSCAERVIDDPSDPAGHAISRRIAAAHCAPYLQFRLLCISRYGDELQKEVVYLSPVHEGRA